MSCHLVQLVYEGGHTAKEDVRKQGGASRESKRPESGKTQRRVRKQARAESEKVSRKDGPCKRTNPPHPPNINEAGQISKTFGIKQRQRREASF